MKLKTLRKSLLLLASVAIAACMVPCVAFAGFSTVEASNAFSGQAGTKAKAVLAGADVAAVLGEDGSLWAWGDNGLGNVGISAESEYVEQPTKVADNVASASIGLCNSALVKKDGSLWTWGHNFYGSIGDGTRGGFVSAPRRVMENAIQCGAAFNTTMALKADGSVWTWGSDRPDDEDPFWSTTPRQRMTGAIKIRDFGYKGGNAFTAIDGGGTLWLWGQEIQSAEPRKIAEGVRDVAIGASPRELLVLKKNGDLLSGNLTDVADGGAMSVKLTGVSFVDGGVFNCLALKDDGSLWTWGDNSAGQIGDGTTEEKTEPVKVLDSVTSAAVGSFFTIALKSDGSIWTWGGLLDNYLCPASSATPQQVAADWFVVESNAPIDLSTADVSVTGLANKTYTGRAITQGPTVKIGSSTLKAGTDYTLSYKGNVKAGRASMLVTGKGSYVGTRVFSFAIAKASVKNAKAGKVKARKYKNGKPIKPRVKLTYNGKKLKKGTDYTLKYKNNKKRGTATIIVKGKGNFKGTKKVKFKIR